MKTFSDCAEGVENAVEDVDGTVMDVVEKSFCILRTKSVSPHAFTPSLNISNASKEFLQNKQENKGQRYCQNVRIKIY